MGYDWGDKRDACWQMYVEEKRTLDEIIEYFKQQMGFVPSKRAFQTQFKRWEFPSKQRLAHRNVDLVNRVRELWEKNTMQKDMLPVLAEEGFEISERELMRLRSKHGLLLRSANGTRDALQNPEADQTTPAFDGAASEEPTTTTPQILEAQRKRKERFEELQAASDQKWSARKRRRHTKQWGDLPPDPPGPPRFPSEVTIGESQKYLGLNQAEYLKVRDQFEGISRAQQLVKKTICGPERWQAAKEQLIRGNPFLLNLFAEPDSEKLTPMHLCLDVICMDVCKRIRNQDVAMPLAEAKNVLGINPEDGRLLRARLIEMLNASGYISRQETGDWEDVKQQWFAETGLNQRFPAEDGPERERGLKALRILCRDMMKRWRDATSARDPNASNKAKRASGGVNAKSSTPRASRAPTQPAILSTSGSAAQSISHPATHSATQAANVSTIADGTMSANRQNEQIDPSLLFAATNSSVLANPLPVSTGMGNDTQYMSTNTPIAAYFRLSASSKVVGVPLIWLAELPSHSVDDLYGAALSFHGAHMYLITKIEGISVGLGGTEMTFQIDQNDELSAYMGFVGEGKATFIVHLRNAYPQ